MESRCSATAHATALDEAAVFDDVAASPGDDHGLNWERIKGGDARYSIRLSLHARPVVTRAGDVMRFESLHFDHDSAYK